jgi:uncharacterized Ntn-hydrolase superfamily protein
MTYSIVARDPATGELGVAVQSHYLAVGPVVPWARPGVGAVATQASVRVDYGPRGLELMADGVPAPDALRRLLEADEGRQSRQVAMVDAAGRVAAHTGSECISQAGDIQGDGVSCQANIMASAVVWPAMLDAFRASSGPLARRLLDALDAAEASGGDLRGRQSAAILVVPATGEPWERVVLLHVEDHPEPLLELRRLLGLHDAYQLVAQADEELVAGRHDAADGLFARAAQLAPESDELRFWAALAFARSGDLELALEHFAAARAVNPDWLELLRRLTPQVAPGAVPLLARLEAAPA